MTHFCAGGSATGGCDRGSGAELLLEHAASNVGFSCWKLIGGAATAPAALAPYPALDFLPRRQYR